MNASHAAVSASEVNIYLASDGRAFHGVEADLVRAFREQVSCGIPDDRLPIDDADTVVYEMAFKYGRADIVVFHVDSSATVIEVKDGSRGYTHVVAGLGQASLYAAQLALSKGAVSRVRKALLWSSTGDATLDGLIEQCCEGAGAIALPWPAMVEIVGAREAVRAILSQESNHGCA